MSLPQVAKRLGKTYGWVWDQYLTVRTRQELRAKGKLSEEEIKQITVSRAIKMHTKQNRSSVPFQVEKTSTFCLRVRCRDEKVLRKVRYSLYGLLSSMSRSPKA